MEVLTKNIFDIIASEVKTINEKIIGLNFLETLKSNIIDTLIDTVNTIENLSEKKMNYENELNENKRNLKISIKYFDNTISNSKKIIEEDSLFLCFNEATNLDIYENETKFKSLVLFKNTGISLPKNTMVNSKFNKNTLLLEIKNVDIS